MTAQTDEKQTATSLGLAKHLITADEYERMGRAGVFGDSARLELLAGEIFEMSPIGSPHAACVKFLSQLLITTFAGKAIVGVQDPVRLDDFSEPQPDLALLRWREDFYRASHPTPADVLLLIEVADTTVETDRRHKLPLYARAGVVEVWIVNLPGACVEVYAEPREGAYQRERVFARGETARSDSVADLVVPVAELLG
jgi:Uma2 family endonuclease